MSFTGRKDEKWITVPDQVGDVRVRIVKPVGTTGALPVILYVHGGGWILGNAGTHDRLVRAPAVGARAALLFVEYDRSPEGKYPVAIEQAYATEGAGEGLDASRLVVAGDSVGGNMTAALTHMAKRRPRTPRAEPGSRDSGHDRGGARGEAAEAYGPADGAGSGTPGARRVAAAGEPA